MWDSHPEPSTVMPGPGWAFPVWIPKELEQLQVGMMAWDGSGSLSTIPRIPRGWECQPKGLGCSIWKWALGCSGSLICNRGPSPPVGWRGWNGSNPNPFPTTSIQTLFQQLLPRVPEIKPLLTHNASLAIRW